MIRIVDKDDDLSGIIEEISLFHVIILRGDALITYPNSLMLQKAVIKVSDLSKLPPHTSTLNQLVNNSPANTDKPTEKEASVK